MEIATNGRPFADQGQRLRRARKRAGLSQERFAPRVGTTRRHLIRLENGEHQPGSTLLVSIARETGQTVDSFGYPSDDEDEESDPLLLAFRQAHPQPQADALYRALMERLRPTEVTS